MHGVLLLIKFNLLHKFTGSRKNDASELFAADQLAEYYHITQSAYRRKPENYIGPSHKTTGAATTTNAFGHIPIRAGARVCALSMWSSFEQFLFCLLFAFYVIAQNDNEHVSGNVFMCLWELGRTCVCV